MCITEYNEAEIMKMFREEGRKEGEEKKAREVVFSLADRRMSAENIADIVKTNLVVVKQWLEGAATR